MNIPVTFTYQSKEYSGYLSEVSGAGAIRNSVWHLMIDNHYWGQLHFLDRGFVFMAQKDTEGMKYLGDYFGEVVTAWYE